MEDGMSRIMPMGERLDRMPGYFNARSVGMDGNFVGRISPTGKEQGSPLGDKGVGTGDGAVGDMEHFSSFDEKAAGLNQPLLISGTAPFSGAGGFNNGGGDDGEMFLVDEGGLGMRSRSEDDTATMRGGGASSNEPETSGGRAQGTLRVAVGTRKKSVRRSRSMEALTVSALGRNGKDGKKKGKGEADDDGDCDGEEEGVTPKRKGMSRAAEEAQKRLEVVDPKRAKRILANRQSAARSKERKLRYISELEERVTLLQKEATGLANQVRALQRENAGYNQENMHLRHRLSCAEEQAKIRDALHLALKDEVGRLQLPSGSVGPYVGDKMLHSSGADMSRMSAKEGLAGDPIGMRGQPHASQPPLVGMGMMGMDMQGMPGGPCFSPMGMPLGPDDSMFPR